MAPCCHVVNQIQVDANQPTALEPHLREQIPFSSSSDAFIAELFFRSKEVDPSGSVTDLLLSFLNNPDFKPKDISFACHLDIESHVATHRQSRSTEKSRLRNASFKPHPIPLNLIDLIIGEVKRICRSDDERLTEMAKMALVHRTWTVPSQRRMHPIKIAGNKRADYFATSAVQNTFGGSLEIVDLGKARMQKIFKRFPRATGLTLHHINAKPYDFFPYFQPLAPILQSLTIEASKLLLAAGMESFCAILPTFVNLQYLSLTAHPTTESTFSTEDDLSHLFRTRAAYPEDTQLPLKTLAIHGFHTDENEFFGEFDIDSAPFGWLFDSSQNLTTLHLSMSLIWALIAGSPRDGPDEELCESLIESLSHSAPFLTHIIYAAGEDSTCDLPEHVLGLVGHCPLLQKLHLSRLGLNPKDLERQPQFISNVPALYINNPLSMSTWAEWDQGFSHFISSTDTGKLRRLYISLRPSTKRRGDPNGMPLTEKVCGEKAIAFQFKANECDDSCVDETEDESEHNNDSN